MYTCGTCEVPMAPMKERRLVADGQGGKVEIDDEWLKCFTCGQEIVVEPLLNQRNERIAEALGLEGAAKKNFVASRNTLANSGHP